MSVLPTEGPLTTPKHTSKGRSHRPLARLSSSRTSPAQGGAFSHPPRVPACPSAQAPPARHREERRSTEVCASSRVSLRDHWEPGLRQGLWVSEASPRVPRGKSARPIHRLLRLNDSSFSFSKKQGQKWLVGILPTEVWASDWIPHRLGAGREIGGSETEHSVTCQDLRQRPCLLTAYLCVHVHTLSHPDTHTHTCRCTHIQTQTHSHTDRHSPTHRHTLIHT